MSDNVIVIIPAKAEHLLVVRLATSGICSRLGMGIEGMEDAKSAVAEACLMVIHDGQGFGAIEITFTYSDGLQVDVAGCKPGTASEPVGDIDGELSLALLQALVEELEVKGGHVRFQMGRGAR